VDLSLFEMTDDAVFIQLRHPATKQLLFEQMPHPDHPEMTIDNPEAPIGYRVYGADSDVFKKYQNKSRNLSMNAQQKRSSLTAEQIDNEVETALVACVAEMVRIEWKGETLTAPRDVKRSFKFMPWAKEQIAEGMNDRTRFMPALAKS
jgi:hypothetical protein